MHTLAKLTLHSAVYTVVEVSKSPKLKSPQYPKIYPFPLYGMLYIFSDGARLTTLMVSSLQSFGSSSCHLQAVGQDEER